MMNALWPKFLKTAYRKEPIVSFVVTVGAVDTVIGGLESSLPLLGVGIGTIGLSIVIRLCLLKGSRLEQTNPVPEYYLPPNSSRPQLPILNRNKNNFP
ncbi:MAG: hypothetical protein AB4080_00910 [Trichodesmium sp.]